MSDEELEALVKQLEAEMHKLYESPILDLDQVRLALKYRSIAAIKQSISRKTFPIKTFELPNRKGKFVLAKDVAQFLAKKVVEQNE